MIYSLSKVEVCPLGSLGHTCELTFLFCDAPVLDMNRGLHKHLQELMHLLPRYWVPVRPALAVWPPLFRSHIQQPPSLPLYLWLDHRPLLKNCSLCIQAFSAMQVERTFIAEPVCDFYIKEKTPRGSGHWPFMGKHQVFTWTEQCYFLFWLSSDFSFSVGWCLPCLQPVDKLQGSPGKVIHQACSRNRTGIQQGLLLFFAVKAKSTFSFCLSLSNQPCESLTC